METQYKQQTTKTKSRSLRIRILSGIIRTNKDKAIPIYFNTINCLLLILWNCEISGFAEVPESLFQSPFSNAICANNTVNFSVYGLCKFTYQSNTQVCWWSSWKGCKEVYCTLILRILGLFPFLIFDDMRIPSSSRT